MKRSRAYLDQLLAALPLFLVFVAVGLPLEEGPHDILWPVLLVAFAAMFITPLTLEALRRQGMEIRVHTFVLMAAWVSMVLSVARPHWLYAIPWVLVTLWIASQAVVQFLRGPRNLARTISLSGPAMLAVGGAWYFADYAKFEPLGFDFLVVRLTAAHFHFAGFVLPAVAGLTLRYLPGRVTKAAAIGVMAGVPMVATGITLTRMGVRVELECCLALIFSVCAFVMGGAQVVLACVALRQHFIVRLLLVLSGLSLMGGMTLAILYALRPWVLLPWLHLPNMWAWHGSIQVFGFAVCGLAGWINWREREAITASADEKTPAVN